jgi:hypothetical protein
VLDKGRNRAQVAPLNREESENKVLRSSAKVRRGTAVRTFSSLHSRGGGAKNRWVPRETAVQPDRALMDCNFRAGEYDHNGFYAPPSSKPYGGIDKQTANLPTLKVI